MGTRAHCGHHVRGVLHRRDRGRAAAERGVCGVCGVVLCVVFAYEQHTQRLTEIAVVMSREYHSHTRSVASIARSRYPSLRRKLV